MLIESRTALAASSAYRVLFNPAGGRCCGGAHLKALSSRERQVFFYMVAGLTVQETAHELGIRPRTAENHRQAVLDKLDLRNTVSVILFAVQHELIRSGLRDHSRIGEIAITPRESRSRIGCASTGFHRGPGA